MGKGKRRKADTRTAGDIEITGTTGATGVANKKQIDAVSIYICTVGYPVLFLEFTLMTLILISLTLAFNYNNLYLAFGVSAVIGVFMYAMTYTIMSIVKTKRHSLVLKRITVIKKIITFVVLMAYILLITYAYAMIYVYFNADAMMGM